MPASEILAALQKYTQVSYNKFMSPEGLEKPQEHAQEKPKRICAWCGKIMGEAEEIVGGMDTHGICPECIKKYFPGQAEKSEKKE